MNRTVPIWPGIVWINSWIQENADRIHSVYKFTGAWDEWAQVELARRWKRQQAVQIELERELWGEDDDRRVDVLFTHCTDKTQSVLELKCQTATEEGEEFGARLIANFEKLKSLTTVGEMWVYGIACGDERKIRTVEQKINAERLTTIQANTQLVGDQWYCFLADPEHHINTFFAKVTDETNVTKGCLKHFD